MKQKTHSSAKKRIKITGTGKFMLPKAWKRHLLANKSKWAKGKNKYGVVAEPANAYALLRCLPNAR
jgi:large subunit ribosomal protein L35